MQPIPGHPDFAHHNPADPVELAELARIDDLATRDTDQVGGTGGDSAPVAPPPPYMWVRLIESDGAGNYRGREVIRGDEGTENLEGGYESTEDVFDFAEVNDRDDVDADEETGDIVQAWRSEHPVVVGLDSGDQPVTASGEAWKFRAGSVAPTAAAYIVYGDKLGESVVLTDTIGGAKIDVISLDLPAGAYRIDVDFKWTYTTDITATDQFLFVTVIDQFGSDLYINRDKEMQLWHEDGSGPQTMLSPEHYTDVFDWVGGTLTLSLTGAYVNSTGAVASIQDPIIILTRIADTLTSISHNAP